jgi:hypothetical protein
MKVKPYIILNTSRKHVNYEEDKNKVPMTVPEMRASWPEIFFLGQNFFEQYSNKLVCLYCLFCMASN